MTTKRIVVGAHYGLKDWLAQRVTAVVLAVYTVILLLALSFLRTNEILFFVTILPYAILLTAIVDTLLMWRGLRKRLTAKFGEEAAKAKGNGMYAAMRAFQLRRSRMPRALVKRGEYPA